MRKPLWQALTLVGVCAVAPLASAQTTPIWSDEFDGDRLDRSTWTFTTGGSGNGNGELQYYTASDNNVYLDDGKLVIEAKRETREGKEFTSGRIHTNGRFGFRYGTIEARIKLPDLADGLWPAFWMLGNNFGVDGWPKSGEWDILEAGYKAAIDAGKVNSSVSGAMHWWHDIDGGSQADYAADVELPFNMNDDFHNYKLVWTPEQVVMSVDDIQYFAMDITDPTMSEFRENPAHIILNLAVGGWNFVEITDPAAITAPLPAKMEVDYVRLYENEHTEVHLAEDNEATGNYGISTELTPVMSELNWGDGTHLYIWNNMVGVATEPFEGSSAMAYDIAPDNWWGMGLLHKDQNLRNYKHGYLHFHMKTEAASNIEINMDSTSGGAGKVTLAPGGDEYGLQRDGEWHHVAIPLSQFAGLDFQTVQQTFSMSGPGQSTPMTIAVDNIYLSESVALEVAEYGSFGIFTETAEHRDAGDFAFGVNGDLFIWEDTLAVAAEDVLEGNGSLDLTSTGKGWYGLGLTAREGFNLSAFDNPNGMLHFSMKTESDATFDIGMKSGSDAVIGQLWLNFSPGSDPYGFVRDGAWHEITIPVSELAQDVDFSDVRQVFQVLGVGEIDDLAIDDIYLSGGEQADIAGGGEEVNRAPVASIKTSVRSGTAPLTVEFDAGSSVDVNGDELTYVWDFGDGSLGSGVIATHEYQNEGSFAVTLSVSDGELEDVTTNYVLVNGNHSSDKSAKRGLGFGHHSEADFAAISEGISWWYNWSHKPDVQIAEVYQNYGVEFAPMAWNGGFDDAAMREYIAAHPDVKYILAFNEPNFLEQANMTPSQAAAEWPRLEAIADEFGLKIVSVAMNYCGECNSEGGTTYYDPIDYFDDFFDVCPDCRVDAISIHAYMEDAGGVEWYVNRFKKYNKPIWMTEFSHWKDWTTLEDQKRFLIQVVDSFENDDDLERYAWFTGRRNGHPYNGLFDYRQSGVLTELGSIYVNMPVHNESNVHTLPARIEAEQYKGMSDIVYPTVEEDKIDVRVEQTEDYNGFLNLSNMDPGSSVLYNVVVPDAGAYDFELRVASELGGTLRFYVEDVQAAQVTVPSTGGLQQWDTITDTLTLPRGAFTLRMEFSDVINVNWLDASKAEVVASSSSSSVVSSSSIASSSSSSVVSSSSSSVMSSSSSSIASSSSSVSSASSVSSSSVASESSSSDSSSEQSSESSVSSSSESSSSVSSVSSASSSSVSSSASSEPNDDQSEEPESNSDSSSIVANGSSGGGGSFGLMGLMLLAFAGALGKTPPGCWRKRL
ncbi:glycosyl hydrolase [uncultured Gilvimarinus sp.]|uniref:glycosyl hydrolase n=1 Tax=uncultured Gilvimarinus sp. TaxID=1689143 RepID=UPI0030DBC474